jgi:putative hydrolase of the HAD superfamily
MKVVWDFGAVLFRWRPLVLMTAALPARAVDEASAAHWRDQVFQAFGGDWLHFDRGTVEPDRLVQQIARRTGLHEHEVQAVIDAVPAELEPLPETVALVHALRERGHRQYYLSNMPAPYADHLERSHAFVREFDDGIFSARVQLVKPEEALFEMAEQRFGLEPQRTVFIDDHPKNIEAADARGWNTVLAKDSASVADGLRGHGLLQG